MVGLYFEDFGNSVFLLPQRGLILGLALNVPTGTYFSDFCLLSSFSQEIYQLHYILLV